MCSEAKLWLVSVFYLFCLFWFLFGSCMWILLCIFAVAHSLSRVSIACNTSVIFWLCTHFFFNEWGKKVHFRHFRSSRVWNSFDFVIHSASLTRENVTVSFPLYFKSWCVLFWKWLNLAIWMVRFLSYEYDTFIL